MFRAIFVLLAFWGASWLAQTWAHSQTSRAMQYMGLGLYVVAELLCTGVLIAWLVL